MYNEQEEVNGRLLDQPVLTYTKTNKAICKVKLETDEETLNLIAWEDIADQLNLLNKGSTVELIGYRKYNDYTKKEEFTIIAFNKYKL
jgi:hypothetical protein